MAADSSEQFVLFNHLAEEFAARYRRGERPALQEYIDRHPELADDIREFFPAVAAMEQVKEDRQEVSEPNAAGPLPPLERLGDYRIIREIGHGGMGVVYEAEQISLRRHVALKVLPQKRLVEARTKQRFEREARAAARLHHTNIVPVFGVGEHEGLPYYVMQFIPGLGLDEVLEELQRLQPGEPGGVSPGRIGKLTGGELRVARKDVSAAAVARSLLTGRFTPAADEAVGQDSDPAAPRQDRNPAPQGDIPAARSEATAAAADAAPPVEAPVAGRLSDTFSLSSSSVVLPGSGRPSGKKPLTYWQSVAQIGVQVADALEYAHRQGIQHRDIKPSNLLLDTTGTVWVTDFGLAKADDQPNLTQTGDLLGTLRYMPPEAFDGKSDARGDVYSLGLTLYELLAFRPAFDEKERNRLVKQMTTAEPARLERLNRDVPRDLVTIVHKAIERDLAHRYPSAAELGADLKRFLADEPIQARRQTQLERYVRWARHHPGIAVLGGVLTAVLVLATVASLLAASYFNQVARSERVARQEAIRQAAAASYYAAEANTQAKEASDNATKAETEARLARHAEQEAQAREKAEAEAKAEAQREKKRAEELLTRAEWLVYAGKLMLAQNDFEAGNGGFALQYLAECQWNLRGWEHRYLWTRINAKQTLLGDTDWVWSVAFSPDGKRIVIGSQKTAMVWDAERGQELLALKGHTSPVRGVAFSPDGKRIVTGAGDRNKPAEAKVWDAGTGREVLALKGLTGEVWSVAYSPDGERIVTGTGDRGGGPGEAKVWDARTGQELLALKCIACVRSVAFSPDGKRIATGAGFVHVSQPGEAKVWDARTGQELLALKGSTDGVHSVAFSPDGKRILTGAGKPGRGEANVWDAATGRELLALKGHTDWVSSVAYSPDGKRIVTGSTDNTVRVWDAETGQEVLALKGHARQVSSVAFGPDGRRIVTGSEDKTVRVWDAERGQEVLTLKGPASMRCVAWGPDGKRIVTGSEDKTVKVWDARTGQELLAFKGLVYSVAFSPDGKRIVTGVGVPNNAAKVWAEAKVWDAGTGRELLALKGHTSWLRSVAYSPDGKRIVTGSDDHTAKVWDAGTGRELLALKGHTGWVYGVAYSPDGKRIVTGSFDQTAKVWDAETGQEVLALKGHAGGVRSVAFSPDGKRIVTGSFDQTAKVWDAETGREVLALKGHTNWVNGVAFSPDGKRIVTAGEDNTVRVWEAQRGQELLTLKGHTSVVFSVAFSPDGKRLVTCSYDKTAKVWDAEKGKEVKDNAWPLPDAAERKRYHTEQAALAVRQKQWFAAEFHLGRVLRDDPENAALHALIAALLKERFPALLRGEDEPGNNAERLTVAQVAYYGKHFAVATRLWAKALESDPKLGNDRQTQPRYNAARAAALAAAGQGQDEPPPDDAAKAKLRRQALDWLKAELTAWGKLLESGRPQDRPSIVQTLSHWQQDTDLASIRDKAALDKLPAEEQKAFVQLWADVAELLKKAGAKPK